MSASADTPDVLNLTGQDTPTPTPAPADDTGNREAASYRRRLRETEAERDTLRDRLAAVQRAEVEHIAAKDLAKPAGLWAAGVNLSDLLDDTGNVDPAKVREATVRAAEDLGLTRPLPANYVAREGANPVWRGPSTDTFESAFGPR